MTDLSRRSFFRLVAGAAALAAVPAEAITQAVDAVATIYCDGVNCDAAGLMALLRGEPVAFARPELAERIGWRGHVLSLGATFTTWDTVRIKGLNDARIEDMRLQAQVLPAVAFEDCERVSIEGLFVYATGVTGDGAALSIESNALPEWKVEKLHNASQRARVGWDWADG